jgi:hypothetical protein
VLGRRGPVQAATNPEIKKLGELEDADIVVDPASRGSTSTGWSRPRSKSRFDDGTIHALSVKTRLTNPDY